MNEEDIEKVEKLIKKCDECKLHECINCEINWTEISSVRRLIDGYKQLEEYYEEQNEVNAKFIPKSKVKEKIEKLQREFDFYAGREHAEWQDGEFDGEQCDDIALQIRTLKELLEE